MRGVGTGGGRECCCCCGGDDGDGVDGGIEREADGDIAIGTSSGAVA